MKLEDFLELLKREEDEELEFKKGIGDSVLKTIVAFSNKEGGKIILGVDDNKKIVGISKKDLEKLQSQINYITPKPKIKIESLRIDNKLIGIINVSKSNKLHSYKGVVYTRIGSSTIALSVEETVEKAYESLILMFDELPCVDCNEEDINIEIVNRYLEVRKEVRKIEIPKVSKEELFKMLKIKRNGKITNAGILFFGKNPQFFYPQSRVRLIVFEGENVKEDMFIYGNLWEIFEKTYNEIKNRLPKGYIIREEKRIEEYPLDLTVLREGLANAIIHRNYFSRSEIIIKIFSNRIEILNPGGFPPGVSPQNPIHKPRNPIIAEYFFNIGIVEKYGSGIIRMKKICKEKGLPLPKYKILEGFTNLILEFMPIYYRDLDEISKKIVNLLIEKDRNTRELVEILGLNKYSILRRLNKLIKKGIVVRKGKGKNVFYSLQR